MPSAVILGGTGQIGAAISNRLISLGWSVTITSRNKPSAVSSAHHQIVDASNSQSLIKALTNPIDLLVSCVAFDEKDAAILLSVAKNVGRIVAISSASVYQDAYGRTLDEARENGFPVFDVPMDENTQTLAPGPKTYSTRKMAMEKRLIEQEVVPVNILRPCAIHGPHSRHAREWWFVKRFLDGRTKIPLAYGGKSQFQTSSVGAIADSVVIAANEELPIIANVCDSDSPTVMEIGQTIMRIMGVEVEFLGLDENAYPPVAGATPWSLPSQFILSSITPSQFSYADTVRPAVEWLVKEVNDENWKEMLPKLAGYPYEHFDYSLDDLAILRS